MTNCAELSAPLAGAFVSAVKGIRPLVASYLCGEITGTELVDAGLFLCSDVALGGLGAAVGQALIPIPVLGAMVGSLSGKCLSYLLEAQLRGSSTAIQERLNAFLKNPRAPPENQPGLFTTKARRTRGNALRRADLS